MDIKCNHRVKSKNTSIVLLNRKSFTIPERIYGVCKCCGKSFEYVKKENGSLLKYKNTKKEGEE